MSEYIDEQYDKFLTNCMIQNYGDLLKVSRSRGINRTLPLLRNYLIGNNKVREEYLFAIRSEMEGQNILDHKVLNSIIDAQLKSFTEGEKKNNKMYSDEIKKIITEGDAEKNADGTVRVANSDKKAPSLVDKIIKDPLLVDYTKVTTEDANAVRDILMNDKDGFEQFSKWCFQIQMNFKFQHQDFHSVIFEFCQKIVHGEIDRGIVTIPPRHSKTQILSIFLPLYSFCYNPTSHNIITSYADDVVQESSGYIRQVMTDNLFQKIFPTVRIDPNKRSLERWGTTKAGVMHAVPTGGKMTQPSGHLKLT